MEIEMIMLCAGCMQTLWEMTMVVVMLNLPQDLWEIILNGDKAVQY